MGSGSILLMSAHDGDVKSNPEACDRTAGLSPESVANPGSDDSDELGV